MPRLKWWKIVNPLLSPFRKRLPGFVVMGGTRSGSTTLHFLLNQHPDIFMTRRQELQYFNRDERFREDLSNYRPHFALAPKRAVAGDVTPMYMHKGYVYDKQGKLRCDRADDSVMRVARLLPDAKIVLTLRNPITRIISEYEKNRLQGKFDVTLMELLAAEERGAGGFGPVYSNRYDIHLAHILAHFPRERVHVMIFEEWTKDLPRSLLPLHRFLGVEPRADVILPGREQSNSRTRYQGVGASIASGDSELTPEKRAELTEQFRPAIRHVEEFLGRPVPW